MLILSLDSASHGCSACVWQDGRVLATAQESMERGQDRRLIPLVQAVMRQAGYNFAQLDRIAVTRGPGSFTGIRIGLAAARGFGLASGKPVIGIDRFAIYNHAINDSTIPHMVILQSKRLELYCQYFPASGSTHEPQMLPPNTILNFLSDKPECVIIGDVGINTAHQQQALTESEVQIAATLASRADMASPDHLPRPLYLREPDVTVRKPVILA